MAGYSGTPLRQKLGIKEQSRAFLLRAPEDVLDELQVSSCPEGEIDVAVAFCHTLAELDAAWEDIAPRMAQNGGFWIAWPKKASKVPSEIDDNSIRIDGLARDWVDNKVCAINEIYSGQRFVIPVARRR